jgi:hypothetical protein
MRYIRRKEFTALLSVLSVFIAMTAALITTLVKIDGFTKSFTLITAAAAVIAAVAASMSIMGSRRLAREREGRRIFLIYAREDLEAARSLAAKLKEHGFNPWLDVDEITPGQVWQKAVIRALEESAIALVLVSEHLAKKGFVQEELKVAMETLQEQERDFSPVVPVRLDNSEIPERLSHVHGVNLFEETGMERLLSGLNRVVSST